MMEITGFGVVLLFIIGGIGFLLTTLVIGKLLRRKTSPSQEQLTTYESGEEPLGSAWGQFNIRFYVVALVFLLFEAELVFLFPWATVFADRDLLEQTNGLWAKFSFMETMIFVSILLVGLLYAWRKGMLEWIRPMSQSKNMKSDVPEDLYKQVNERY
ncbi:MAG: NADH-quinone oxidoreductase subunit A [Bacteroidota bacterium]